MAEMSSQEVELLDELLQEFLGRVRRGERPAVSEYEERFPHLAGEIRRLFPSLAMLEHAVPGQGTPTAGVSSPPSELPERVGDYQIVREIGRGGMGIVYEAEQQTLGRRVALKALAGRLLGPVHRERFRREARAAARLRHPHIVPVHEVGFQDDVPYYVMPLVDGRSLDRFVTPVRAPAAGAVPATVVDVPPTDPSSPVKTSSPALVPPRRGDPGYCRWVAQMGVDVADALAHAHRRGIIHRDVKPSNLLLDREGTVWLTDFGLAFQTGEPGEEESPLTQTGDIVGTLRYMAPERFEGWADARSDLYSLGLTLYELLTGRPAFPEPDRLRLVEQIGHATPIPPRRHDRQIPRDLETIILKAASREPGHRYPSAEALKADLQSFLDGRPVQARRRTLLARTWLWCRRRPAAGALAALLVVLTLTIPILASGMAFLMRRQRDEAQENLERAHVAEAAFKEQRNEALQMLVMRARAGRNSDEMGRRFDGLSALAQAARSRPDLELDPRTRSEMRNEALACLALVDLRFHAAVGQSREFNRAIGDPSGRYCAILQNSGRVSIRETQSNDEITALPVVASQPYTALFSPDSQYLAVSYRGEKGALHVWNWREGRQVLPPCAGVVPSAFDFRSDSRQLVVGTQRRQLERYDLVKGVRVDSLPTSVEIRKLAFNPTGTFIAVTPHSLNQPLIAYSFDGLDPRTYTLPPGTLPHDVAWSPDGHFLAAACQGQDHPILLWQLNTPTQPIRVLRGHSDAPVLIEFSADGRFLASIGWDGTFRLWDPYGERLLLTAPCGPQVDLPLHLGNGRLPLTLRPDQVDIWEIALGREAAALGTPTYDRALRSPDFSPDGRLMIAGGETGLHVWDLATRRFAGYALGRKIRAARFLPSGGQIAAWSDAGLELMPLTRIANGFHIPIPRRVIPRDSGSHPESMVLDPSGRLAYLADRAKGHVQRVDLATGQVQRVSGNHPGLNTVAVSPDGNLLATATWQGKNVQLWDARTGKSVGEPFPCESAFCGFSPDGELLLYGDGREFIFYDLKTGKERFKRSRPDPGPLPGSFAFRPDGAVVALALSRFRVTLIDLATGDEVAVLTNPIQEPITSLAFSPDGGRLAVGLTYRAFRVWDLRRVRGHLREMNLDWTGLDESPDLLPTDPTPVKITSFVVALRRDDR